MYAQYGVPSVVPVSDLDRVNLKLGAAIKYLAVDGYHRTMALQYLINSKDPGDDYWKKDHKYQVLVMYNATEAQLRAVSAGTRSMSGFLTLLAPPRLSGVARTSGFGRGTPWTIYNG